tara:strand:- start:854 stop:1078 length:225 start_codon:yes stop_codon:yes gene_type:complete
MELSFVDLRFSRKRELLSKRCVKRRIFDHMFPHVCKVSSDENIIKSFSIRIEKALINPKTTRYVLLTIIIAESS